MGAIRGEIPVTTQKGTVAIPDRLKASDAEEPFGCGRPCSGMISSS